MDKITKTLFILKDKKPVRASVLEWSSWSESSERLIGYDKIRNIEISTIFLGIATQYPFNENSPMFETMIFGGKISGRQYRYVTYDEAEEGHKKAIAEVIENL